MMSAPEGDKSATVLRALLTGDFDRYKQLAQSLDNEEGRDFLRLVSAALLKISDRKFGSGDVTAAVVEWIAKIRSESEVAAKSFDPRISEKVLLFVLGKTDRQDLSGRQLRDSQLLLLPALVDDQGLDSTEIDELLTAARALIRR